jgi:hypothetical protein
VRFEERVLRVGRRLDLAPVAVEDVLATLDQAAAARYGTVVDGV